MSDIFSQFSQGVSNALGTLAANVDPTNPQGAAFFSQYAQINVQNLSGVPVRFALKDSNELQGSPDAPTAILLPHPNWWDIAAGADDYIFNCYTRVLYWYAFGPGKQWAGTFYFPNPPGAPIPMQRLDMGASYRAYRPYRITLNG